MSRYSLNRVSSIRVMGGTWVQVHWCSSTWIFVLFLYIFSTVYIFLQTYTSYISQLSFPTTAGWRTRNQTTEERITSWRRRTTITSLTGVLKTAPSARFAVSASAKQNPWKTLTPVSSLYRQHASSKWNKPYRRPILVINRWKIQILLFVLKLSNSNYTIYQIW